MTFAVSDNVTFKPGPKSTSTVTAEVTGYAESARGQFLVTKDAAGVERKIRPGACVAAPKGKKAA